MLRHRAGKRREAVDLMELAVRTRPDDASLWFNYGVACAGASLPDAARQCFERVVALVPDHPGARAWLARLPGARAGAR